MQQRRPTRATSRLAALLVAVLGLTTLVAPAAAHVLLRPEPRAIPLMRVEPVTVIKRLPRPEPRPDPEPSAVPVRREPLDRQPSPRPEPQPTPEVSPPLSVRVVSFNVLGSSHTRGRGGRPSGVARMAGAAQLVRDAQLVGLQELQSDQAASVARRLPAYDIYPGNAMGRRFSHNSLMWRADLFTAVERHVIGIPYHRGRIWPMPYVKLRHVSGTELWMGNFHNPASTQRAGNNARWRRVAVQKEIALARALGADGTPVVFTGDFNDRAEFFCPVARSGVLRASNGGDAGPGFCRPPAGALIDWIVGSPEITWSGYTAIRGGLVARTSDHPLVAATATLPEQVLDED